MTATPPLQADPLPRPSILAAAGARFEALRQRARRGIWTETAAVVLVALVAYAAVTYLVDRNLRLEVPFRLALLLVFAFFVARIVRDRLVRPSRVALDDTEMALAVERQDPALHQALISSLQFDRALGGPQRVVESRDLMARVVADVHGRLHSLPFDAALDARRMARYTRIGAACLGLFLAWGVLDGRGLGLWALRNLGMSTVEWPRYTKLHFLDAADGRIRLPQGDPYTVRVGVEGPVPDQIFLRYAYRSGDDGVEPMSRTGDGQYTLTLETMLENATLRAEGGDGRSEPLLVEIVERPRIEDLRVEIHYPDYMGKEPEHVPPTEGEVRLLRGSRLTLAGRSHKPIAEAFVLLGEQKTSLAQQGDHDFGGELAPRAGGLLTVDVIDRDQLGAGAPPRLMLRVVEDKAPTVDLELRGISSLITAEARIPGDLLVRDDFGLISVEAGIRIVLDGPAGQPRPAGQEPAEAAREAPFEPAAVVYADPLTRGAVRYETVASLDLKQFEVPGNPDANPIRPGVLLTVRYGAKDNYGPGEPHLSYGEELSFRVVTRDKLVEELRRRQVEQRLELERVRDDHREAMLAFGETMNPTADSPRAAAARSRFKTLARQQQTLGRRVQFIGETYQRILWEYENNRVWEPAKVREYESQTSVPLGHLAKESFPVTSSQVATFSDTGDESVRNAAKEGYADILARIEAIIKVMEEAETLAALIEQLRGVIRKEDEALQTAEEAQRQAAENVFKPGTPAGQGRDPQDKRDSDPLDASRKPDQKPEKPPGGGR